MSDEDKPPQRFPILSRAANTVTDYGIGAARYVKSLGSSLGSAAASYVYDTGQQREDELDIYQNHRDVGFVDRTTMYGLITPSYVLQFKEYREQDYPRYIPETRPPPSSNPTPEETKIFELYDTLDNLKRGQQAITFLKNQFDEVYERNHFNYDEEFYVALSHFYYNLYLLTGGYYFIKENRNIISVPIDLVIKIIIITLQSKGDTSYGSSIINSEFNKRLRLDDFTTPMRYSTRDFIKEYITSKYIHPPSYSSDEYKVNDGKFAPGMDKVIDKNMPNFVGSMQYDPTNLDVLRLITAQNKIESVEREITRLYAIIHANNEKIRDREVQSTYRQLEMYDAAKTRPPPFSKAAAEASSRRLLGHAPFPGDDYATDKYNEGAENYNRRYPNANLTITTKKGGKSRKSRKQKQRKSKKQKKSRKSRKSRK